MVETKLVDFWKADQQPLTLVDKIRCKQTISSMESVQAYGGKTICITQWTQVEVHNDRLEEPDYKVMQVQGVTEDGEVVEFNTSSSSFIEGMLDMCSDIEDECKALKIEVVAVPSNNYKDRFFYLPRIIDIVS